MKPDFELRESYDRRYIHTRVGGSLQEYLPHVQGHVVCGCFRKDINPNAPHKVRLGHGPGVVHWAEVFSEQSYPIPVFIKAAPNRWRYEGKWRVTEAIREPEQIEDLVAAPNDVAMILRFVKG
jgi:hypothetical protein